MEEYINNIIVFCDMNYVLELMTLGASVCFIVADVYGYFDVTTVTGTDTDTDTVLNSLDNNNNVEVGALNKDKDILALQNPSTSDSELGLPVLEKKKKVFGIVMSEYTFSCLKGGIAFLNGIMLFELLGIGGPLPRVFDYLLYLPLKSYGFGYRGLTSREAEECDLMIAHIEEIVARGPWSYIPSLAERHTNALIKTAIDEAFAESQTRACQRAIRQMSYFNQTVGLFTWRMGVGFCQDYMYFNQIGNSINPYETKMDVLFMLLRKSSF